MKSASAAAFSIALICAAGTVAAQSGEPARGERLFNQQCKTCHTVDQGGATGLGPNLFGMFGRKAGSTEGFASSDAMKKSGIVWDDAALADYLKDPKGKVPDTKMIYAGLKRPEQLADMIAYLKKATQ
jgi:cytochrome c